MINRVILIGRLGSDPEVRTLENGVQVARFGLATEKGYKVDGEWHEKTTWHNIVAWRKLAERAVETLHKGDLVYVEAEINNRVVDHDGQKKYYTDIVANYFRIVYSKKAGSGQMPGADDAPPSFPTVAETEAVKAAAAKISGDTPAVTADEDLPF